MLRRCASRVSFGLKNGKMRTYNSTPNLSLDQKKSHPEKYLFLKKVIHEKYSGHVVHHVGHLVYLHDSHHVQLHVGWFFLATLSTFSRSPCPPRRLLLLLLLSSCHYSSITYHWNSTFVYKFCLQVLKDLSSLLSITLSLKFRNVVLQKLYRLT